ncbi:MAG: class I SAM-dependent rRNA methyltransferase [Spirochaetaceae bacterium]|jgi:23S rRNA (cytosine1962-C5)-methyltransferase|nr:class I SAM-dependent rRNA methyltransferase [Spirochaetaceae bacterium]
MKRIILKRGEELRHFAGHPWVFDNEILSVMPDKSNVPNNGGIGQLEKGEIADVETAHKEYVGRAFVNPHSKIVARLYSSSKEGVDEGFFKRRIRQAIGTRKNYNLEKESCRLVFAEADFLPGLIIDQYVGWDAEKIFANGNLSFPLDFNTLCETFGTPQKWISVQFLSYGMDIRKSEILSAVEQVLQNPEKLEENSESPAVSGKIEGIIERSAAPVREKEDLPLYEAVLKGTFPSGGIIIFENDFPFLVDLVQGQKTGHFLDQKENHKRAADAAKQLQTSLGRTIKVLDGFCYSGAFALNIARSCDAEIIAADSSEAALGVLKKNCELNGVSTITVAAENVFDLLTKYERAKETFDLIVLDPPAFAKSRTAMDGAVRGYKEINLKAIKLLSPNGILITCSCSYAMTDEKFKAIIAEAATDARKRLYQLDFCYQSTDHPILVGYDESQYLKCGFYRVFKK